MVSSRLFGRRAWTGVVTGSLLIFIVSAGDRRLLAQNEQDWVGKPVITKTGAVLRVGKQVVEDTPLENAHGGSRNGTRLYRVEQVNGTWLWLQDENSGIAGWVTADWVVPYAQAVDYFTNEIRAKPKDTAAYARRGHVWRHKQELDKAIADYSEVIRLEPTNEIGWCDRGEVWFAMQDYDKAIADLGEAIRLEPKCAMAYTTRGNVWRDKQDYDKAIADYGEAIRLNPKSTAAYNGRGNAWTEKREYANAIADYDEVIRLDPKHALAHLNRGNVWYASKDYKKASADYDEAIRLDPKDAGAYFNRSVAQTILHRGEAVAGFKAVIDLRGGKGVLTTYAVILGHIAARLAGDVAAAQAFLERTPDKPETQAWPYPVVKLLRGEIDEPALLAAAADDDEKTDARCFLGLDHLIKKHEAQALVHFRWVRDHGNHESVAYVIVEAELDRLEKR